MEDCLELVLAPGMIPTYAVDKRMILCKDVDDNLEVELVGTLDLIDNLGRASYSYINDIEELLSYYLDEIPIRVEKTANADKFPDLAFVSSHLVNMESITKNNYS